MPTRNRFYLAKGAIDNVPQQTYDNLEILLAEDGSRCSIEDYIDSLNNEKIHYITHKERVFVLKEIMT
jgi:hypothetical protein|tara:strand:- start:170 stop:373 length:204 start_codon:yes stop_codon:yes gene_type:complete